MARRGWLLRGLPQVSQCPGGRLTVLITGEIRRLLVRGAIASKDPTTDRPGERELEKRIDARIDGAIPAVIVLYALFILRIQNELKLD